MELKDEMDQLLDSLLNDDAPQQQEAVQAVKQAYQELSPDAKAMFHPTRELTRSYLDLATRGVRFLREVRRFITELKQGGLPLAGTAQSLDSSKIHVVPLPSQGAEEDPGGTGSES